MKSKKEVLNDHISIVFPRISFFLSTINSSFFSLNLKMCYWAVKISFSFLTLELESDGWKKDQFFSTYKEIL